MKKLLRIYWWIFPVFILVVIAAIYLVPSDIRQPEQLETGKEGYEWDVPDLARVPLTAEGDLIRYGKELVVNTSHFLGPKGKVASISNGMNCQNCHLDAGTRFLGNNYSAVFSCYPKFRARSGSLESIFKRVNDCLERSLNGHSLDSGSREMQAFVAYIKWLGHDVPKNIKPDGAGIPDLPFLNRAADSSMGKQVFLDRCQRCHGEHGNGLYDSANNAYTYPPLWGEHSFTTGAGLFRISRFAGFVKYNMPFTLLPGEQKLTDEEAWDVAAYVISKPRPSKIFKGDWPDISTKPFDHPFGPYADEFTEQQHKYGPFGMMKKKGK